MPRRHLWIIVLVLLACVSWGFLARPAPPPVNSGNWWIEMRLGSEARDQGQVSEADGRFTNALTISREPRQRVAALEALADVRCDPKLWEEAARLRHKHGI